MRILRSGGLFCAFLLATFSASGKLILVNTTNNISPGPGETNLVQAIGLLADGDTIGFNIPGPGPFYLETPSFDPDNGYPAISNHNVTIDGYTQPGSTPNTNTILSSNNARIQIVIDARGDGYHSEEVPGAFDLRESEQLMIKGTNVTIRGLCFLGPGTGNHNTFDPSRYAVAFSPGSHGGHVCGCWFGVDLDRTNVFRFADAVAAFTDGTDYVNGTVVGVASNTATGSDARAQFNVIVGEFIPVIMEGERYRISGNFFNVFPDGVTDFNVEATNDLEAFIEIGRLGNYVIIGTDGDGVNDAEERNIFGGVTKPGGDQLMEWYTGGRSNIIIAGNYFGLATDGVTRFANSFRLVGGFGNMSTVRIGSDFDGVSDELEANVIAMNYPFDQIFPSPAPTNVLPAFADLAIGSRVSFRGNQLLGNNTCPFTWANGSSNLLTRLTNYSGRFMDTNGANGVIPVLSTNSSQGRLRGSCALSTGLYTNIIIDLYAADNEGWTNGQKFAFRELAYLNPMDLTTNYYGFAQGRVYLGSFMENGPQDLNPAPGQFEFDIHNLALDTNTLLTVSASYSADPPGTHNGRTHTSVFAMPITLLPAPTLTVVASQAGPRLLWPTNSGLFSIQSTPGLAPLNWTDLAPQPQITIMGSNYTANLTASNTSRFYRLAR